MEVEHPAFDPVLRIDALWWNEPGGFIRGVIHGALASKSNRRKLVTFGHGENARPAIIKSKEARDYEEHFQCVVLASSLRDLPLDGKLWLRVTVHQENMRRDLDVALLCDCLQRSGVINNDRAIWSLSAERKIDKARPRVEFEIGVIV